MPGQQISDPVDVSSLRIDFCYDWAAAERVRASLEPEGRRHVTTLRTPECYQNTVSIDADDALRTQPDAQIFDEVYIVISDWVGN